MERFRSLLTPMEFTRLDELVDVMFTTVADVEAGIVDAVAEKIDDANKLTPPTETGPSGLEFTDVAVLDSKRNEIIRRSFS